MVACLSTKGGTTRLGRVLISVEIPVAGGAQVDEGNPDNLRAMMDAAKEYGIYR
jgi:hypothetical protein